MKSIQVFDPAMCCSTGVCGVDVDQQLVSFAADVDWAKQNGAQIERFNLAQQPMDFADNPAREGISGALRAGSAAVDSGRWRSGPGWPLSESQRVGAMGGYCQPQRLNRKRPAGCCSVRKSCC